MLEPKEEIKSIEEEYNICLKQGWVHNTPINQVILDYKERKKYFDIYFNEIAGKIKNNEISILHILIGEAPPYYPNPYYPKQSDRKYFYHHYHSPATEYFRQPYIHFVGPPPDNKFLLKNKKKYINNLINSGVFIFDIFPFPIFQSSSIRKRINKEDNQHSKASSFNEIESEFDNYLSKYFETRLCNISNILKGINNKIDIKYYLFAPKLTSMQFLSWYINKPERCFKLNSFEKLNVDFEAKETIDFDKAEEKHLKKLKLNTEVLKQYPIFMGDNGNPSFENFFNGKKIK